MNSAGRTAEKRPQGQSSIADESRDASEWITRAQLGDREAFGQLVRLYQDRLFNAILRTVGNEDDARELTQEAFMQALEKIDSFRGDSQPYTWLFRIGLNLAITQLRKSNRRKTFTSDSTSATSPLDGTDRRQTNDPLAMLESRERGALVLAALEKLEPEVRAILVMRDIEAFDYTQMAAVLGLPLGTLKSRLFRARAALREALLPFWKESK